MASGDFPNLFRKRDVTAKNLVVIAIKFKYILHSCIKVNVTICRVLWLVFLIDFRDL